MAHDPREIGRQIGSIIADAKRQASERVIQAPIEPSRVVVEAPSVSVEAPAVTIATEEIAKAIEESRFDAGDLMAVISEAAKTVAAVDLSGLRESIEYIDNKQNIADLADRVQEQTTILAETQNNNASVVAEAMIDLNKSQGEQMQSMVQAVNAMMETIVLQGQMINQVVAMQQELIQIGYARRMLIMGSDGEPVGLQIERQVN